MKSNILQRLFLTLTLCLVGVITSWAADESYTIDGIVYTLDESRKVATVTGYERGITTANIRESVEGYAVTTIGKEAFYQCGSLTSVTIPSSVVVIEDRAFQYCHSLTSVTIPSSVVVIGDYAFNYCSSLTSVTIPSFVVVIGDGAFESCSSLTSVTIPSSVTTIGDRAFAYCKSLTSVSIPSSVKTIGDRAFYNCSSLTSVTIPSSVTTIGTEPFAYCTSLTSISVSSNNKFFASDGKALFGTPNLGITGIKINYSLKSVAGGIKTYDIPSYVINIREGAFEGCKSLTSVTIPSSVSSIKDWTFSYCESLTSVTIPSSVNDIGKSAFEGCKSLTSVTIPSSVTTIGEYAFNGCSSASIKVLSPKINIGESAFEKCKNVILNSSDIDMDPLAFESPTPIVHTSVLWQPNSQSYSLTLTTSGNIDGYWFSAKNVYNTAVSKGYKFESYRILPPDAIEIINKYEDVLSFISQKKNIYNVIDSKLRSNLDNLLDQISYFAGLASKEDSELATLKANLTTAFNDVCNAINGQIDLNNDLSDVYKQAEYIASDGRIVENKAFGFPYADFNAAFNQAKKELDGECATQNTIDRLQDILDIINSAAKVDFAKSEYLTLYSNKALIVPEGMKAAVVVAKGDDIRNDYRYTSGATIPARTGVLLKGENGYLGYLLEGASTETAPTDNLLHGTLNDEMTNVEGAGKYYKLSFDRETTSVIGFYWGATDGAAFINKAGKAFLAIPATLNAQQLRGFSLIDMDKTDAITGIDGNTISANAPLHVFDMNGRRIEAKSIDDLQPGIYVVNGKKIIK